MADDEPIKAWLRMHDDPPPLGEVSIDVARRLVIGAAIDTPTAQDRPVRGYRCRYHDPHGNLGILNNPNACRGHGPTWDCDIVALVDSDVTYVYHRDTGWAPMPNLAHPENTASPTAVDS